MDYTNLIQNILIYALPVLLAITVHEAAHGYAARHYGDNTAYALGRITLNPLKHIDPIGTILMPLLLLFSGSPFLFGYAKPVPVRIGNLNNPKRDMVWVALAGPASNLLMALIWGIIFYLLKAADMNEPFFNKMAQGGILVNAVMFAFNLFPLPPLDGGRILIGVLPYKYAELVSRVEPWGFFIVLGLVVAGVINTIWMTPMMNVTYGLLELALSPLAMLVK
jgi:Zn-dependent protease